MVMPISTAADVFTHDATSYRSCMPNTGSAWHCCRKLFIPIDGINRVTGCLVRVMAVLVSFKTGLRPLVPNVFKAGASSILGWCMRCAIVQRACIARVLWETGIDLVMLCTHVVLGGGRVVVVHVV
jgi:hypothetical protein